MSLELTPHGAYGKRPLRGGCLRGVQPDGAEYVAWPGDPIFSTATMVATHFWSDTLQRWERINLEDAE